MMTADLCRKHGISSATLEVRKTMYGGLEPWPPRPPLVGRFEHARQLFGISERRACTIFGVDSASVRYAPRHSDATCGRGCAR